MAPQKAGDTGDVIGQDRNPFAPLHDVGERRRHGRPDPGGALHRLGKFRRVR
jgi:hypothetical protein